MFLGGFILPSNFKHSLIGYKTSEVKQALDFKNDEFEKLYKEYREELFKLINENQRLKGEVDNLEGETSVYRASKEKIKNTLYDEYMKDISALHAAEKKLACMIGEKNKLIEIKRNKGEAIKLSINRLLEEVQAIVENGAK
jgi:cell division septum initiation protein DivIVA